MASTLGNTTTPLHHRAAGSLMPAAFPKAAISVGGSYEAQTLAEAFGVSPRAKSALARAVLGSTTSTLLDEAHVPFVVV